MMKDLIGLCCGCLMGVVVPLLFCRLAKHWNVLSDIAVGEIIAYTSEVIPFCFCLFDCAYGLFNWLIFGSFRFLDIKIPTMALRVCAGGFLAILPAAALIVRVFPEVRSPEGVWQGFLLLGLLPLAVIGASTVSQNSMMSSYPRSISICILIDASLLLRVDCCSCEAKRQD